MVERAIHDFYPESFPIKANDIEVKHGPMVPTYFLMQMLQQKYGDGFKFYFMMGSDLIPSLITWDEG